MTENPTFGNEKPSLPKDEGFSFADFVTKRRTKPTVRCRVYLDYAGAQECVEIEDEIEAVSDELEMARKRASDYKALALGETNEHANQVELLSERLSELRDDLRRVQQRIFESQLNFALTWSDWEEPSRVTNKAMSEWVADEAPDEIKAIAERDGEEKALTEAQERGHTASLYQYIGAACLVASIKALTDCAGEPVPAPKSTKEAKVFLEKALAPDQREKLLLVVNKSIGAGTGNGKGWFSSLDAGFPR